MDRADQIKPVNLDGKIVASGAANVELAEKLNEVIFMLNSLIAPFEIYTDNSERRIN